MVFAWATIELASRNASSPPEPTVPSPEKSWESTITGLPAGEPGEANWALRWKSGIEGSTPSAM